MIVQARDMERVNQVATIIEHAAASGVIAQVAVEINGGYGEEARYNEVTKILAKAAEGMPTLEGLSEPIRFSYSPKWEYDFSYHRNISLRMLETQNAMWLDSDDLPPDFKAFAATALAISTVELEESGTLPAGLMTTYQYTDTYSQMRERLIFNISEWSWYGEVHEVLVHDGRGAVVFMQDEKLKITHLDTRDRVSSTMRNIHILQRQLISPRMGRGVKARLRNAFYLMSEYAGMDKHQAVLDMFTGFVSMMLEEDSVCESESLILKKIATQVFYSASACKWLEPELAEFGQIVLDLVRRAIQWNPASNELHGLMVMYGLEQKDESIFMEHWHQLSEDPVDMTDVNWNFYGSFKHAMMAEWILANSKMNKQVLAKAIQAIMPGFLCDRYTQSFHKVVERLKAELVEHQIGVAYLDPALMDKPFALAFVARTFGVTVGSDAFTMMIPSTSPYIFALAHGPVALSFVSYQAIADGDLSFLKEPVPNSVDVRHMYVMEHPAQIANFTHGDVVLATGMPEGHSRIHLPGWTVTPVPEIPFGLSDEERVELETSITAMAIEVGASYERVQRARTSASYFHLITAQLGTEIDGNVVTDMEVQRDFFTPNSYIEPSKYGMICEQSVFMRNPEVGSARNLTLDAYNDTSVRIIEGELVHNSTGTKTLSRVYQMLLTAKDVGSAVIDGNDVKALPLVATQVYRFVNRESMTEQEQGRVRTKGKGLRKLAFYCEAGVEMWDGTTPYVRGIGASESSLIFLADAMAKLTNQHGEIIYDVYVFSPSGHRQVRNIRGVSYLDKSKFAAWLEGNSDDVEAVIASRMISRPQPMYEIEQCGIPVIQWVHDVPSLHDLQQALKNFSAVVVPSDAAVLHLDFRATEAGEWLPECKVIPNTMFPYMASWSKEAMASALEHSSYGSLFKMADKQKLRVITSQPERCLDGSLRVADEMGTDKSVTVVCYGYDNFLFYHGNSFEAAAKVHQWRRQISKHNAIQLGRLNSWTINELLTNAESWLYYGDGFQETYCVAAEEAMKHRLPIIANSLGSGKLCQAISSLMATHGYVQGATSGEGVREQAIFFYGGLTPSSPNKLRGERDTNLAIARSWQALIEQVRK